MFFLTCFKACLTSFVLSTIFFWRFYLIEANNIGYQTSETFFFSFQKSLLESVPKIPYRPEPISYWILLHIALHKNCPWDEWTWRLTRTPRPLFCSLTPLCRTDRPGPIRMSWGRSAVTSAHISQANGFHVKGRLGFQKEISVLPETTDPKITHHCITACLKYLAEHQNQVINKFR